MKPREGITSIKFKWADMRVDNPPMFSISKGAFEDEDNWHVWFYQKHFFFYKWCYLTVSGVWYGFYFR